ncbi:6-pyruvoyl trahydropterin synthase family protein [Halomonas elongata]|uniref:6-pyruvoyl trahydropterin synthase family protein n=1 Tax=Halomonas elongata TaxID=2746 RepID=UPI0023AF150A|nr:6-carboxytetrahydropterin synthase [Halomonas elongata]
MFSLTVRDHMMIAHSFHGDVFGPARKLHGATYVVDVSFFRPTLDEHDLVVDIGLASETLSTVLKEFTLSNLDDHEAFQGRNTTTEFMAQAVFQRMAWAITDGRLGEGAKGLSAMKVTLHESHIAWASYEGSLEWEA